MARAFKDLQRLVIRDAEEVKLLRAGVIRLIKDKRPVAMKQQMKLITLYQKLATK